MMRVPGAPKGESLESVYEYLSVASVRSDARFTAELQSYLQSDYGRFLLTLDLVPDVEGRLLEIGADPYFTTLLLERYRRFDMVLANGGTEGRSTQDVLGFGTPHERTMECVVLNVEGDALPLEDEAFEAVLFCEVLEHLTMDPMKALGNINRVLKPGGTLVVTTPNAVRADSAADLVAGKSTSDKSSGYGPYGRHNREYTRWEVQDLLRRSGFEVRTLFTSDFDVDFADGSKHTRNLKRRLFDAALRFARRSDEDMGFGLFCAAVKTGPPETTKPSWLYRSYPEDELS